MHCHEFIAMNEDIDQWSMPFAPNSMKNVLDWIKHKSLDPNLRILIYNLLNSVEDKIPNLPQKCSDLRHTQWYSFRWEHGPTHHSILPLSFLCLRGLSMQMQLFHWILLKLNVMCANLSRLYPPMMLLVKSSLIPHISVPPFSLPIFIITPSHWSDVSSLHANSSWWFMFYSSTLIHYQENTSCLQAVSPWWQFS